MRTPSSPFYCAWFFATVACVGVYSIPAQSQESAEVGSEELRFPERPIRIIVYTGPGGLIDFTARKFAEVARKYAPEQPIVVINKPGAGGIVAFEEVLQMPADGYNILAVTRSNISKIVSTGREDLIENVNWFTYLMDNPHVVITNQNSGLTSWDKVVADAANRKGRQIWLGVDIGGVKHVSGIRVWEKTGVHARWIPYGSGGQAAAALLGEIGQVYFGNPSDAARNPTLGIIAVCAESRMAAFPETPTFAELGINGLEEELIWRGFAFKKGTPQPVLDWFDALVRKVDADPSWRVQWESEGINVNYKPAAEFAAVVKADQTLFRQTLEPLGLLKQPTGSKWLGLLKPTTAVQLGNLLLLALFVGGAVFLARSGRRHAFGEALVAAAAVFTAASILLMSSLLPRPNAIDTVGAAGVPFLWALTLLLLAGMQVVITLQKKAENPGAQFSLMASFRTDYLLPVFLVFVLFYLLAITVVGYHLASLLFLPATCWLLGFRRWLPMTALTIAWLSFAYFIFQKALYVDLPVGWLIQVVQP